jgi:hypothetical protein
MSRTAGGASKNMWWIRTWRIPLSVEWEIIEWRLSVIERITDPEKAARSFRSRA